MITSTTFMRVLAAGAALMMAAHASWAQELKLDREALDAAIRDYILSHPEVVREALQKAELNEQLAHTKKVLKQEADAIYRAGGVSIGPKDAKITIVEFLDLNCGYCRAAVPILKAFLAKNPDVRLLVRDVASLGADSEAAGRILFAAEKQGKGPALFEAIMMRKGKASERTALEEAQKLGLDIERLKTDAASEEATTLLKKTRTLADTLSVTSTPLIVIGHGGIQGVAETFEDQVSKLVGDVRAKGCDVC